ncbi:MAG: acetyltransferase [Methyloprofundus sp.]|nr:acetyltransferase [Methyloprofundus sp.]
MKSIYVIGTSGFASEVTEYIESQNEYRILGYFDKDDGNYLKYGYTAPFLGFEKDYRFEESDNVVIAVADGELRKTIYDSLKNQGVLFPLITHPLSFIGNTCQIEEGAVICPFVTITSNAKIGKNFQANIYSYIAHDCIIGDNVTFAPGVKCNGNVVIEDNVYIGTGVVIHQGKIARPLKIGCGAVIAAGSVVTKSIEQGVTVFGNPAIEFTKENIKKRLG